MVVRITRFCLFVRPSDYGLEARLKAIAQCIDDHNLAQLLTHGTYLFRNSQIIGTFYGGTFFIRALLIVYPDNVFPYIFLFFSRAIMVMRRGMVVQ